MTVIRAAGGVLWRGDDGGVEVCLIHRPRHDDWSLPKGKLEPGEHPLAAAVREVGEEAGVCGIPQVRLPLVRYITPDGQPKTVDYWSMRARPGEDLAVAGEVDEVAWLPVEKAESQLTYGHDVGVLRSFAALPRVTVTLSVVRHAQAGSRDTWSGPDAARPLDAAGIEQAHTLAGLLALTRPERLISASARRCVQTLVPLAGSLDLPIDVDSTFDEPAAGQDAHECGLAAAGRLTELAETRAAAAICSQGTVIPVALSRLSGRGVPDFHTPKGSGWLIAFAGGRLIGIDQF